MHHFVTECAHVTTFLLQNGALWNMEQLYCGVSDIVLFYLWEQTSSTLQMTVQANGVLYCSDDGHTTTGKIKRNVDL